MHTTMAPIISAYKIPDRCLFKRYVKTIEKYVILWLQVGGDRVRCSNYLQTAECIDIKQITAC